MRPSPILLLACFACLTFMAGAQTFGSASKASANTTINNAITVLNEVNESGYLIFYPNLTQAYADLNKSMQVYNVSPSASEVLANRAEAEAQAQYQQINTYRQDSIGVMLFLTAILAYIVVIVARPVPGKSRGRKRRRD